MLGGMADAADRPLWTGDFIRLCVFYFGVFLLGYPLLPIVPLHLRGLGAGLAESGRFVSAFTVGSAVGCLVMGPLGDRLGQRRVMRNASFAMVGFLAAYAVLPWRAAFLLLAPLNGLVWSGLRTAAVARAGTILPDAHRAQGMSFFGLASPAGIAVGPLLGLGLLPLLGHRALLLGLALGFLGLAFLVRPERAQASGMTPHALLPALPEAWILLPASALFLMGMSYGPIPPFAAQEARLLHLPWSSALLSSLALGMVGLRLLLGVTGMGRRPVALLLPMALLSAFGMAALALLPGGLLRHASGGALYGAGFALFHTLVFMHVMEAGDPARRGAAVGALYFSYDAGQAAGSFLLGLTMEHAGRLGGAAAGFRWGWGAAALLLGVSALLAWRIQRPRPRASA
jgi:MFS family permease